MQQITRNILTMCVVLTLVTTSLLFSLWSIIGSPAQSSLASSISSFNDYAVPGGDPWGTAFDGSGRVWVALPGCDFSPKCSSSTPPGKLALFDPGTRSWVTVVTLPAGYGQPIFVTVDKNGKIWFTMPVTNAIGTYDPVASTVTQWAVPTSGAGPWGIAIDSGGKIWFTEHYVNHIGSFDPNSQTFHEIPTPASNSNPYGITVDSSNNIWFTENTDSVALIGEYTTQGVLNEFKIRNISTGGTGLTPHLITIDPNGNIWWSEGWVSAIGMLNVAAARPGTNSGVTEYSYTPTCGSCGSHTSGISADNQGLIWLDDSLQNTFGSFPVGGGSFSFYNGGSQNRIWPRTDRPGEAMPIARAPSPSPAMPGSFPIPVATAIARCSARVPPMPRCLPAARSARSATAISAMCYVGRTGTTGTRRTSMEPV
jgi:streptogramin lyase